VSRPTVRQPLFEAYWSFAAERHAVFERRLTNRSSPWTTDPIIARYRFCNSFRAADRVTQELVAVAYADPTHTAEDIFLRTVCFRLFSRPETWRLIETEAGPLTAANFDAELIGERLEVARADGVRLYTGAFILAAGPAYGHHRKHRNHLALLEAMIAAELPAQVAAASSLREVYELLLAWPLIGPFMAYQLAIDLNYTALINFDEDDFTVPGPGALRGLAKVFADLGGLDPAEAIHWLLEYQDRVEAELGIVQPRLFGRPLHAIDIQNLLCEVDKYARVAFPMLESNRSRIKQRFEADPAPLPMVFPPKWGLQIPAQLLSSKPLPTVCP
jgi:alpha-glutamyl/putrescinyl thymine pyrophosphorylase clade 1